VSDQAPELISTGVQVAADTGKRLGLTWTLRPGTITAIDPLTVVHDGDFQQTKIGIISLIGRLPVGTRVMTLGIPPAGNYAIGLIDVVPMDSRVIEGVRGSDTAGLVTSGTTELDLPFLQVSGLDLIKDTVYKLEAFFILATQSVATDVFQVRFRLDTALTGTLIGLSQFNAGVTTAVSMTSHGNYEATTTSHSTIFVSVLRTVGTGTLTVVPRTAGGSGQLSSYSSVSQIGVLNRNWFLQ